MWGPGEGGAKLSGGRGDQVCGREGDLSYFKRKEERTGIDFRVLSDLVGGIGRKHILVD
jgi:hypothetical protein